MSPSTQIPVERIGRYSIVDKLGAGAMGAVYRARDDKLGREVAIKVVHAAPSGSLQDEVTRSRFDNEVRALAAFNHPNVVPVYDTGDEGGTPYLVMELVDGRSLDSLVKSGERMPASQVRALGIQLAGALAAAHARGILHRDVKPANILQGQDGRFKLADFGIAHIPDSTMTLTGQFVGTPTYSPPEALQLGEFGPYTDVYGLAATMYHALIGQPPYGERGVLTPGALTTDAGPEPLDRLDPAIPGDLAGAIGRALAKKPSDRPSADEFARALAGGEFKAAAVVAPMAGGPSSTSKWPLIAIGAAVAVVLLVALASGGDGDGPKRGPLVPAAMPMAGAAGNQAQPANGRDRKAARHFSKAIEHLDRGKLKEAEKELERVLERNPNDEQARSLLERVREARDHYERDDGRYYYEED